MINNKMVEPWGSIADYIAVLVLSSYFYIVIIRSLSRYFNQRGKSNRLLEVLDENSGDLFPFLLYLMTMVNGVVMMIVAFNLEFLSIKVVSIANFIKCAYMFFTMVKNWIEGNQDDGY